MSDGNQNAVYRLESPTYGKATLTTLKKIAAAMDVALIVRFVPYSELVDWASGTPRVNAGLDYEAIAVPSFSVEQEAGIFDVDALPNDVSVATEHRAAVIHATDKFGALQGLGNVA